MCSSETTKLFTNFFFAFFCQVNPLIGNFQVEVIDLTSDSNKTFKSLKLSLYVHFVCTSIFLSNPEFALQLLEGNSLGLWIYKQHDKELQRRHRGKERKGQPAGVFCQHRKDQRDDGVHHPVRRRA